tara:strand:+ start:380 stop:727 length:348 start_codon:yes stop_codon:yes gene_type:complete
MSWEDVLKATDGLDQYNVDELLVQPIERLGFQLQQTDESYMIGDNPESGEAVWNTGQMSLNFRGPTGITYVVKRSIMTVPSGKQYVVFKGMNIDDRLFDYNAVVDYFTNEVEDLT